MARRGKGDRGDYEKISEMAWDLDAGHGGVGAVGGRERPVVGSTGWAGDGRANEAEPDAGLWPAVGADGQYRAIDACRYDEELQHEHDLILCEGHRVLWRFGEQLRQEAIDYVRWSAAGGIVGRTVRTALKSARQVVRQGHNVAKSETGIAYRAINPAYAETTAQSGQFYRSGAAGRLGNDGIYANSTVEGAIAEFQYHNPGVNPAVFRVEYPVSPTLRISPPSGYFNQPLPFTQGANILIAPSLRAHGTVNLLIREGAIPAGRVQ